MISHIFEVPIPVLEKILRAVLVYTSLILMLRLFGKRELAQLNPFDLIVLLMLANTVQNAVIGEDSSVTGGVIGAVALLLANYVTVRIMFHYPQLDKLFGGSPTVLIEDGKPDKAALSQELLTVRELRLAANLQGIDDLRDVSRGRLEPNGTFSFERRHPALAERQRDELAAQIEALSQRLDALLRQKP